MREKPKTKLRLGFIGTGLRGQGHVELALLREDCEIAAIADPDARMVADTLKLIAEKGAKKPDVYGNGERDYLNLLEGKTAAHKWEDAQTWLDRYDHPLWKKYGADAKTAGHGGMDFFVFHHFVESAKQNIAPQIDVYDAATWLAITPLSEASIATGSTPQAFPDFTRGRWTERKADFAMGDIF